MWGLIRKNVERIVRLWAQTVFPPLITTVLYIVVFGYSLGRDISEMGGISYLEFIIPGLIMMAVITNSYGNVTAAFYTARLQKWIEEVMVAPISNLEMIAAFVIGGIIRGIMVGGVIFITSFFIADIHIQNWFLIIALLIMTTLAFSLAAFLNALFARNFDDVAFVPNFILTPLTFLGGVFYSVSVLPETWQTITKLNPIFWIISAFREGFYGISEISVWFSFAFLTIMSIALYAASIYYVRKGVNLRS